MSIDLVWHAFEILIGVVTLYFLVRKELRQERQARQKQHQDNLNAMSEFLSDAKYFRIHGHDEINRAKDGEDVVLTTEGLRFPERVNGRHP